MFDTLFRFEHGQSTHSASLSQLETRPLFTCQAEQCMAYLSVAMRCEMILLRITIQKVWLWTSGLPDDSELVKLMRSRLRVLKR
jgi:hypothetical protein